MKRFILFFSFSLLFSNLYSQKLQEWNIQSHTFLDNREYFNRYTKPQTIFGSRLGITAGFSLDSVHLLQVGSDFLYELGSTYEDIKIKPIVYYKYRTENVQFTFGSFPRDTNVEYPKILHNDTLAYYRPNVEGGMLYLKIKKGYQKIWIDWTGRQTETVNEAFMAGTYGKYNFDKFFFENYYYMYHHAGTLTKHFLRDNGGGLFLLGLDATEKHHMIFVTGLAFSTDRVRPDPYDVSIGFYNRLEYVNKIYVGRITHYLGKGLSLAYGDPFYKAGNYLRFDAEANFIQHKNVNLQLKFSFHVTDDGLDSSQMLKLVFNLSGTKFK